MNKLYYLIILLSLVNAAMAQTKKAKQISFAISNVEPAKPFGKFAGFFTQNFHPGIEAGYSIT